LQKPELWNAFKKLTRTKSDSSVEINMHMPVAFVLASLNDAAIEPENLYKKSIKHTVVNASTISGII